MGNIENGFKACQASQQAFQTSADLPLLGSDAVSLHYNTFIKNTCKISNNNKRFCAVSFIYKANNFVFSNRINV